MVRCTTLRMHVILFPLCLVLRSYHDSSLFVPNVLHTCFVVGGSTLLDALRCEALRYLKVGLLRQFKEDMLVYGILILYNL